MNQRVPAAECRREAKTETASLASLSAHLGLSKATISRVLTQAPAAKSIPHKTQQRILAAAQMLNYRPNLLARSLRRGKSRTIGVTVPELSEGYATLVLAGLEETLAEAGYAMMLITHHHRDTVLAQIRRMFAERAVDGIVAVDTILPSVSDIPTVTVSCPNPHAGVTNILLNHDLAAELALMHLQVLGHHRIAIIKGQSFSSDTQVRWQSIQAAAARLRLTLHPELVLQMEENLATDEPGYRATERLLLSGARFTAIFAFNDISAIGAMRALQVAGRSVPEEISVVGFDDVSLAAYHRPALTTVRQPLHHMGALAAATILNVVATGETSGASRLIVEPELVVRASTAPRCEVAEKFIAGLTSSETESRVPRPQALSASR